MRRRRLLRPLILTAGDAIELATGQGSSDFLTVNSRFANLAGSQDVLGLGKLEQAMVL